MGNRGAEMVHPFGSHGPPDASRRGMTTFDFRLDFDFPFEFFPAFPRPFDFPTFDYYSNSGPPELAASHELEHAIFDDAIFRAWAQSNALIRNRKK